MSPATSIVIEILVWAIVITLILSVLIHWDFIHDLLRFTARLPRSPLRRPRLRDLFETQRDYIRWVDSPDYIRMMRRTTLFVLVCEIFLLIMVLISQIGN